MRAITGAIVSSNPCSLKEAYNFLQDYCRTPDSYLRNSDCGTYVVTLIPAIREQHLFLRRRCSPAKQQQGNTYLDTHGYEGVVEEERWQQGGEMDWETEVPFGGAHGSIEEEKVAVTVGEKKRKKRRKEEEPYHEDKDVAGIGSHVPASPEILSERRKKVKHSDKELVSVKQEPDLILEEDVGSERKKKKKRKYSVQESASIVKQESGLVVEEDLGSEKKKGNKKKEKVYVVKLEEDVVEVKAQIVNNGVADQGIADGEKKRKKKKHSEKEHYSKGVKDEEKMPIDNDLNSEKKKKKKRGRGDDEVQEQGEHIKKKKQRKESRE